MKQLPSYLKRLLIDYIVVLILAIGLFMVLPLPFTSETSFCDQAICKGYEFEAVTQHGWYWLGGYHTTIQGLLPMSFQETMAYTERYDSIPGWHIAVLALISIILAVCLYLARQIVKHYAMKLKRLG